MANKKSSGRFLKENVKHRNASKTEPVRQKPQKRSKRITVLAFTALAICVSLAASIFFLSNLGLSFQLPGRKIASGVEIAGVDVGGLNKREAKALVQNEVISAFETKTLTVAVQDQTFEIQPSLSEVTLDVDGAVKEAFQYGTQNNPATDVDLSPYLSLNTDGILQKIREFAVNFPTEGEDGSFEIVKEIQNEVEVPVLNVRIGSVYYDFSENAMLNTILEAYNNCNFSAVYECNQIIGESVNLDTIYQEYCQEPVNALWDKETRQVIPSQIGFSFDLEAAKEALAAAQPGDTFTFPFEKILPELDTESVNSMLYRDVLGTYTAKSGSSYNRDTNLRLACESLDGTILYPGDVFAYNAALGERTAERGYLPADSYLGNETVKTYGGGICQPSSSLYYCALLADLEIVERSNHGFVSSYMPYGMDATVDWKGPDFKFRNSTNYPIRIDAKADGGTVVISLVGTDEKDYYVKMEYEVLTTTAWEEKTIETADKAQDGKVKTSPYTGYTVQTYKLKYNKEDDTLISREKEAYSVYAKRNKEVYKYVGEETEPTTEPTTAPTTPPETTAPPETPPEDMPPENNGGIGQVGSNDKLPGEE